MDINLFDKAILIEAKRDNIRKAIDDLGRTSDVVVSNMNTTNADILFAIGLTDSLAVILDDDMAFLIIRFTEQLLIEKQVSLKKEFDEL